MSKSKQQLLDERYLRMARIWAENSYCERRQVGALIVRGDAIISDGYNGTPSGFENICEDENNKTKPYVLQFGGNVVRDILSLHRVCQVDHTSRNPAGGVF